MAGDSFCCYICGLGSDKHVPPLKKKKKKGFITRFGLNTSPEIRVLQGNNSEKLIKYANVSWDLIPGAAGLGD